jgi:hypothetical protein
MGLLVLFSTLIVYMERAEDCGKKDTSGGAIWFEHGGDSDNGNTQVNLSYNFLLPDGNSVYTFQNCNHKESWINREPRIGVIEEIKEAGFEGQPRRFTNQREVLCHLEVPVAQARPVILIAAWRAAADRPEANLLANQAR